VLAACGGNRGGIGGGENADYIPVGASIDYAHDSCDLCCTDDHIFYLDLGGNIIGLNFDIDFVLNMLGEPLHTFDQPSCAFEGIDRFFLFGGVQIQTYPASGGVDRVHTIMLMDDSITTTGGIRLGDSTERVLAAYGNDYEYAYGMYIFTRGNTSLKIMTDGNAVTSIAYELIV
jgi:hypothetical protein